MSYRVINGKMQYIQDLQPYTTNTKSKEISNNNSTCKFNELLQSELNKNKELTISQHAKQRLMERNIEFTKDDISKINDAINRAEKKGCKEGVILYKGVALITSIKNRTVITAMNKDESQGNIFTNIDSLVIL